MILHHIKIAIRSLLRHKIHTLTNVLGLSLGIACCLLITLYILDELSYDRFHERSDRLYRLQYEVGFAGSEFATARAPITLAPLLPEYFSEIEQVARVYPRSASIATAHNQDEATDLRSFEETRVFFADSSLLEMLSFDFIHGDPATALDAPFSTVISKSIAEKYFGDLNPLGRNLILQDEHEFKITGVYEDFPGNSHIHMDVIFPYDNMYSAERGEVGEFLRENLAQNWMITHSHTYVMLRENTDYNAVNEKFEAFKEKFSDERIRDRQKFSLQPITDIRLKAPDISGSPEPVNSMTIIYLFMGIAVVTLLIACINFINLSTAGYIKRATEVGIRKVLGADRGGLVRQFLGESWVITLIAMLLSLAWVALLLPTINELTLKEFTMGDLWQTELILGMGIIFLLTGLLSGSYPAFFVAGFPIVPVLKGKNPTNPAKKWNVRKVLVVAQFAASVALIVGTAALYLQVRLLTQQPLGFNQEQIVTLQLFSQNLNSLFGGVDGPMRQRMNSFEEALLKHSQIEGVTLSSEAPGRGVVRRNVIPEGKTEEDRIVVPVTSVDYDYVEVYGLTVIAGRDFDKSFGTDHTEAFMINEKALETFDWVSPDSALGKEVNREGKIGKVVGVVKDFNFENLNQEIRPLLMEVTAPVFSVFSVKILAGDVPETLTYMEETWREFFPEKVFEYAFLDEQIDSQYQSEQRLSKIIGYFSALAIFISCLGLFSLSLFMAIDRSKEVAIRKVLGASVPQLLGLLSGGFLKLIAISTVIAWPLAWWFLDKWLADYAYSIDLGWSLFLIPTLAVMLIALLTIGFQTFRTAQTHPVEALRDE